MKHTMFLLTGTVVVLIIHSISPKFFWIFIVMLPFVWVLLVATMFMGSTLNEANRYLLGFQPSEMAKICLISTVAFILSRQKDKIPEGISFKIIWGFTILTCLLIFFDNFSTAGILYGVVVVMMFIGQVSFKRISVLVLVTFTAISLVFAFIWFTPETAKKVGLKRGVTWVERLTDYNEKSNIKEGNYVVTDDNFQTTQANIAVARGGIFGKMPGNGQQRDFLPQAYSDFIYAIIIEETGIIGGIFVLSLYVFLFIRAGVIAGRCTKLFPKYLVMGSAMMLVMQALVNMAVSVGLMPVTGQPLPLISKGGSSILITCVFIGIILSVSRFENPRGVMQEEEIEEEFEEEKRLAAEDDRLNAQVVY
jgi:cell division protein FtsW